MFSVRDEIYNAKKYNKQEFIDTTVIESPDTGNNLSQNWLKKVLTLSVVAKNRFS